VAALPSPGRGATEVNSVLDAARATRDLRIMKTSVFGAGSWRGRLVSDSPPPNDHGYAAIAQTFELTLIEALI
jgi:hypothetical protein